MGLKITSIVMNLLLLVLCFSFLISHGLPKNWILWSSLLVWFLAPLVNLFYIYKK